MACCRDEYRPAVHHKKSRRTALPGVGAARHAWNTWEQRHREQERRIQALEEALKTGRRWRFGKKSEAFQGEQRQLVDEDVAADGTDIEQQLAALLPGVKDSSANSPHRQPLSPNLLREDIRLDLDNPVCPDCNHALRFLRDETSERLEYVPAHFIVHRTVRPQYSCPCCDTVHAVPLPAQLIEKGLPGPGLLAQVVIAKACDHLPLYRQQKIYQRLGADIPRSTLSDWFGTVGAMLKPLADALQRDLLRQPVLQADETPLLLAQPRPGEKPERLPVGIRQRCRRCTDHPVV